MSTYQELIDLFHEFRAFSEPETRDGIHDYSPEAMARQHAGLKAFKTRWQELDTSDWSIEDRVDSFLVLGEMLLSMEKKALIREAGKIVRRILADHQVVRMDEDIVRKGYEIISAYEERYAP